MKVTKNALKLLSKGKFMLAKKAPEIFVYAGIAGTVVATVSACKRMKDVDEILEEHKDEVQKLKDEASVTPVNEYRKELTKIYVTTAAKTVKVMAFPFALGLVSAGSIIHGKNLYRKWYVDSSAMVAAVTSDYNKLYDNVVKEVGEERARELKYGIENTTIEETTVNEKGKEKTTKKKAKVVGDSGSNYILRWNADFADEWVDDFESNYHRVSLLVASMESFIANRETHHMFWIEAVEQLFGSRGLKKIIDDRKKNNLPVPIMGGWIYDPEKAKSINIDFMKDPESKSDVLICLVPDGNISELGSK